MRPAASAPENTPAPRAGSRASLLVIFLTVFIDLLGFGIVLPLLPIYAKQFAVDYGYSPETRGWMIGALMASYSLMQFLFLPVWGKLSDRIGRRPVLLIGLAGSTLFYGLFAIATIQRSLIGLFIARVGAGIAGATISTAQAYIADITTKEKRARGMALIGAAFALGFTLGPMIGAATLLAGDSAEVNPWPGAFAAGLSFFALLLAFFKLGESWSPGAATAGRRWFDTSALADATRTPSVALLLLTSFITVFAFANFESTLSLQIDHMLERRSEGKIDSPSLERLVSWVGARGYESPEEIKQVSVFVVFTYLGIVLTLAQGFLVRRLADKISEPVMAASGAAMAIAGYAILAWAVSQGDFSLVLVGMAVEVVGFAFVTPSLQSLISRRSSPERQGAILGLGQSATSLARILGPLLGVRLLTQRVEYPYWLAAALMLFGLLMILAAARRGRDFEMQSLVSESA